MSDSTKPPVSLRTRPQISARALIIASSVFIIVANNGALFKALTARLDIWSFPGATFVLSVYLLLITVMGLAFFIAGHPYTLKPVIIFFIVLSAVLSYFSQQLGVVFDIDMVRNMAETVRDNNRQEAFELLSFPLVLHLFLYSVLPTALVLYVRPRYDKALRELLFRSGYTLAMLLIIGVLVWTNFKFTSFFVRENREVRVYTIPTYPLFAVQLYFKKLKKHENATFRVVGADAVQVKTGKTRTIGLMVVGETARADHFSLNGYERKTNPLLEEENILNFSHVTAAGTSTAYSVPSMFSFLPPKKFSPEKAKSESNALDVLTQAGVSVFWIENNSSSKHVADRITTVDLRKAPDHTAPLYSDGGYYDEALVDYLEPLIASTEQDVLIVLHTMGSHGPTYHKRYPESFTHFLPDCKGNSPQECSTEEVINAYDNTILYTDFVVSGLIQFLKAHAPGDDTFLLYASDHGESLGEDGVYLHGLPHFLAPDAQTQVPMFAWLSEGYAVDQKMDGAAKKATVDTEVSHQNIPHSLLGLLNVETDLYLKDYDLFVGYR